MESNFFEILHCEAEYNIVHYRLKLYDCVCKINKLLNCQDHFIVVAFTYMSVA